MSASPAIGIDLGTTFSCVGVFQNGRVEIIANDQGNRTTPSCVAFTDKERLIGEAAVNQATVNPSNTVFDVRRLIGRRFEDEEVQRDMKRWPFKVIDSREIPKIEVQHCGVTKQFTAEQISSMVLSKLKETAENYLGQKVTNAVITVPAYFNVNQRQATIDAGKLAGLNVLRLISEPTAAAIAYGMDKRFDGQRNVLIFDWGGDTFDVSIMSIRNGKFEVKAVGGDTHLGGEDITSLLVDHCVEIFGREHKEIDLAANKKAISRLRRECEQAKRMLSSAEFTHVSVDSLFEGIDFSACLTRARFEHLCSNLFERTINAVRSAMFDAKMEKADISEILLVGGSTRIPKVAKMLEDFFGGKEVKKSINADEAVAYGAAMLAANLLPKATPLSLGLEDSLGSMMTVVKRNTLIPTKQTCRRTTTRDNQTSVTFKIFEGERARATSNYLLGEFTVTGFPPRPRGETVFDTTFEIDENGILQVSAVESSTKKRSSIKISNYIGRLSKEETEQMLKDAVTNKQEDEKERSRMAAKSELVDCIYSIKRRLEKEKLKQKILEDNRKAILARCEKALKWTDTENQATKEDYERLRKKFESVCSLLMNQRNAKP